MIRWTTLCSAHMWHGLISVHFMLVFYKLSKEMNLKMKTFARIIHYVRGDHRVIVRI